MPGVTPNFTVDEWHDVDVAMKAHPDVIAALAERGVTDLSLVLFDAWTYAKALMPPQYADRRLGWCDIWVRKTPNGNPYAHPVPGLKLIVDMNTCELLDIERGPDPGMPEVKGEYVPAEWGGEQRTDITPLQIVQPDGVSFAVEGEELRWQKWSMRVGFNYREGLTLHAVSYDGRDVAHRMSFAEMIVPYRDPSFEHVRRTAYDIGEWGLGFMTTSLELGCDCLGEITYLDATLHDSSGEPFTIAQRRSASTRRTTRSSGSTSTSTRAPRCGGCVASSSRSMRRSPTTSTSSTGASTRTATSSARCAPRGSW